MFSFTYCRSCVYIVIGSLVCRRFYDNIMIASKKYSHCLTVFEKFLVYLPCGKHETTCIPQTY